MKHEQPVAGKKTATMVLSLLSAILALYVVFCALGQTVLFNPDAYVNVIFAGKFGDSTLDRIRSSFDSQNAELELPAEELYDTLDKQDILLYEQGYVREFVDCLVHQKDFFYEDYTCTGIQEPVRELVKTYCQETGQAYDEAEADEIVAYVQNSINSKLQFVPNLAVAAMHLISTKVGKAEAALSYGSPAALLTLLLLAVITLLNRKEKPYRWLFTVVSIFWLAFCVITVPLIMAAIYHAPGRLALAYGQLYYFVEGMWNTAVIKPMIVFSVLQALLTVLLVILILCRVREKNVGKQKDFRTIITEEGQFFVVEDQEEA